MGANYAEEEKRKKSAWRGDKKRDGKGTPLKKHLLMASWWEQIAAIPSFDDALQAASFFLKCNHQYITWNHILLVIIYNSQEIYIKDYILRQIKDDIASG